MQLFRLRLPLLATGLVSAALGAASLLGGCQQQEEKPGVFGGQGAKVATLDEKPLPDSAGNPEPLGPCGKNGPVSDTVLIDDFEDGNDRLFKGFERDGFWYAASDKTEGSSISPTGTFAAELLPAAESNKENRYAAHFVASGQKEWGVVFGGQLNWTKDGIKCPLNVSGFAGIRFRAKGPGTLRFSVAVPEVIPKDGGGICKERCYDVHFKQFILNEGWDSYEARFEKLQQMGWGLEAHFTPQRVVSLGLHVDVKNLPIDFWLDDVEFIPKSAPAPATAAR